MTTNSYRQLTIDLTEEQYNSLLDRAMTFRVKGLYDPVLLSQLPDLADPYSDDVTVYLYLNTLAQGAFNEAE